MTTSQTPEIEHKRLPIAATELRLAGDEDTSMAFTGYGAVFGNVDSYGDVIAKGAFRATLREARRSGNWPAMLSQHGSFIGGDDDMPIGIWTSMEEDAVGLKVEGRLADTTRGRDIHALLKMTPRPALNGLSIGFRPKKYTLGTKPDEPRRTLEEVDLWEVSLVTFPANPKARISSVKSIDNIRAYERWLRDAGFSKAAAEKLASRGWPGLNGGPDQSEFDDLNDAARRALGALKSINGDIR